MSTGLELASGLVLPLEAVTETFAILAKRGSGKTYTAAVLVEEFLGAGLPVVVVDPIGVWWGLRSSADGTGDGLPMVIFGGDHADLPLRENAGGLLADLVVQQRVSVVLDLSWLSKAAARRFMCAFAAGLYHRNREPLQVGRQLGSGTNTDAPPYRHSNGQSCYGCQICLDVEEVTG